MSSYFHKNNILFVFSSLLLCHTNNYIIGNLKSLWTETIKHTFAKSENILQHVFFKYKRFLNSNFWDIIKVNAKRELATNL